MGAAAGPFVDVSAKAGACHWIGGVVAGSWFVVKYVRPSRARGCGPEFRGYQVRIDVQLVIDDAMRTGWLAGGLSDRNP